MRKRHVGLMLIILAVAMLACIGGGSGGTTSTTGSRSASSSESCPPEGTRGQVKHSPDAPLWQSSDPDDDRLVARVPQGAAVATTGRCVPGQSGVLPMIEVRWLNLDPGGDPVGWMFRVDVELAK